MKTTDSDHTPEQCRELFARMSEYLDQELDDAACRAMEDHLRRCPPCRVCLSTLQRTVEMCRAARKHQARDKFSSQLRELIERLV